MSMLSTALGQTLTWAPAIGVFGCIFYSLYLSNLYRRHASTEHSTPNEGMGDNKEEETNSKAQKSAFRATRLTSNTFLITEFDDIYSEHPFIYARIFKPANTLLIVDTGCGGATHDPDVGITSLRDFIENVKLDCNNGEPLNGAGSMGYVVVLSHCHYDHILGVEAFTSDSQILASSHKPSFISPSNLPNHSLCEALGVRTPSYQPTLVPHLHSIQSKDNVSLNTVILHTPGHTPDELALWDEEDRIIYVGDTLYEHAPIMFPGEGSIKTWMDSVDQLISFVQSQESVQEKHRARINCGHATAAAPAMDVLQSARRFMKDILSGREPVRERQTKRGESFVQYKQDDGRFALICPERLVLEASLKASL